MIKKRKKRRTTELTLQLDRESSVGMVAGMERKKACLVVIGGMNIGEAIPLKEGVNTILGRSSDSGGVIMDDGISRHHAEVYSEGNGRFFIRDLDSTNGVFIDGERIDTRELSEGDKVLLGRRTVLKFAYQDLMDIEFQRKMYNSSVRDALTGAFNRKHFDERISSEISFTNRHRVPISLLMIDLDHFKKVNDTWGHQAGDQVLVAMSSAVSQTLREEDFFARYGGEEFVIIARGIDGVGALALAERLRIIVEELKILSPDGARIPVTVSIGACTSPAGGEVGSTQLIKATDENLYKAKEAGRNRVTVSVLPVAKQ